MIKLDKFEDDSEVTDSGIILPEFENHVSEGGRPLVQVSNRLYKRTGEVIAVSAAAQKDLERNEAGISIGDKVVVNETALSRTYWFITDFDKKVAEHEGYILVTPQMIEAKLL